MVSGSKNLSEAEEYTWGELLYQKCRGIGANLYDNITRTDGTSTIQDDLIDVDEYLDELRRDF